MWWYSPAPDLVQYAELEGKVAAVVPVFMGPPLRVIVCLEMSRKLCHLMSEVNCMRFAMVAQYTKMQGCAPTKALRTRSASFICLSPTMGLQVQEQANHGAFSASTEARKAAKPNKTAFECRPETGSEQ